MSDVEPQFAWWKFFNQYSDRGKGGATVSLIELKLIWSIEKSGNIRNGQF